MEIKGRVVHPPSTEVFTTREVHPAEKYIAVDENGFLQASPETSGFDLAEGVFKVASYVWDTDTLSWVRATQSTGGSVSEGASAKKKLFDSASATTLYIGEAAPGTSQATPSWRIQRLTFDATGFPSAVEYAAVGAATQVWNNRASLSYS